MKRSRRTGLQQPLPLLGLIVLLFVAWTLLQQDHRGSDGRNAKERMRAAGFNGVFTGENIACGNKTAAQAVASWTDDDLHRDNVLGPRYRYAGIGVAPGRYGPSWTLDLGSD